MRSLTRFMLCFFVLSAAAVAHRCPFDKPQHYSEKIGNYVIAIAPQGDEDDHLCRATISRSGKRAFQVSGWSLEIEKISGIDINGDGAPEAVVTEDTGGAHCCWNYWIFSLGSKPTVIAKIYNQTPIKFERDAGRQFVLRTDDGNFDYFDSLCHACSVFPDVFLRIDGKTILDISANYRGVFDQRISAARAGLSDADRRLLKNASTKEAIDVDTEQRLEATVLTIVLENLYSGREQLAWSSLRELWIPSDIDRLRALIMSTRRKGILRYLTRSKDDKRAEILQK